MTCDMKKKTPQETVEQFNESEAIWSFVRESNAIEFITRPPTKPEIDEFTRFIALPKITVAELEQFVRVYQPDAVLRDKVGMNVRVGKYTPPLGGPGIRAVLETMLEQKEAAHFKHLAYELLHPFTDCNGRSGRAIWAWQMKTFPLGFLHKFYYQILADMSERSDAKMLAAMVANLPE